MDRRSRPSNHSRRIKSARSAYVLIAVLILVGIGSVLSFSFIASHMNAPIETALDEAHQRAVRAAQTGLSIALREIRNGSMTTDPATDSLEDIWHDHWGYDGVIVALSDYDASAAKGSNLDVVGIEVRRYVDDDNGNTEYAGASGPSQFNYNPQYYKITCVGVARDAQGNTLAFHPTEHVASIPRADWHFSNLVYSSEGYPRDAALGVISSPWAGQGSPYIVKNSYVAGGVYSWYHTRIRGTITKDALYDDQPPPVPPGAPVPPGPGNNGWITLPPGANRLILPTMTLADYGLNVDRTYKIDGVTFQAQAIAASQAAETEILDLGAGSSKTNPANIVVYDAGVTLTLDARNYRIDCVGTIVADTIVITDTAGNDDASDIDFHFVPAIPGMPSIVCNKLILKNNKPKPEGTTFIEGPALIREYITSEKDGAATFRGFIVSNDTATNPPSGQGSYKGTVYIVAEDAPDQPGPFTDLQIINGVTYEATPNSGNSPPPAPQIVRGHAGEHSIQFSDNFRSNHTWPP